jgi:hypothetical protein
MYREGRVSVEDVQVQWLENYQRPSLRGVDCIHGHFPLRRFVSSAFNLRNIFVAWLREPLQWRISLYYYWKQNYPHPTNRHLNRIFDENWDLERFCLDPTFDNYQSRFLAGFPRWRINFIGVSDNYVSDLAYLSRQVLRRELNVHKKNKSKKPIESPGMGFDARLMHRFESNNQVDYRNYRMAKRASDARMLAESPLQWESMSKAA